jgi:hypothetical protein
VQQATRQVRSQSNERGHVKLAWSASIPLCCNIKKNTKSKFAKKNINTHNNIIVFYLCKTSTHRSRSDTVLQHIKTKISYEDEQEQAKI